MFKVGQKVVRIAPVKGNRYGLKYVPEAGKIYTVREVVWYDEECLYLVELVNPKIHTNDHGYAERCFCAYNFRTLKDDEVTKEILEKFKPTEEKPDVEIKETQKTENLDAFQKSGNG